MHVMEYVKFINVKCSPLQMSLAGVASSETPFFTNMTPVFNGYGSVAVPILAASFNSYQGLVVVSKMPSRNDHFQRS
jgi:hypothetical protein